MLLRFSVSNFRAIRGLQTLNLTASNYDKVLPENLLPAELPGLKGKRWLKGVALYGANASGKSTVIQAMKALSDWVGQSAKTTDPEEAIPFIDPYAFDASAGEEPTAFAIVFVAEGTRYEYRVAATKKLIVYESLRAWPLGKEQVWFERDWNAATGAHDFTPETPTGMPRDRDTEARTLPNVLYISKSIAENRKEMKPAFRWLVSQLRFLDLSTRSNFGSGFTLRQIEGEDLDLKAKILKVLKHADIGIVDVLAVEGEPPNEEVFKVLHSFSPEVVEMLKNDGKSRPRIMQPQLLHQGPECKSAPLAWEKESAGTHRLFALIGPWLDILKKGYTVCIDEIETSMHPHMVRELLKLFFSKEENTGGAQIIFTTHNPLLLDLGLMRRDQVWFTDKNEEGVAHLYPLTNYQPRQGESLIRGYMAGRYGAIPFVPRGLLGTFSLLQETQLERVAEDA